MKNVNWKSKDVAYDERKGESSGRAASLYTLPIVIFVDSQYVGTYLLP